MAKKVLSWLLVSACVLAGWGCGYSTRALVRRDITSIYVPVFENATFRRGYEKDLTNAVIEELKRFTRLSFAPAGSADSVLTGEIVEVEERVVTKTELDEILEKRISVTVEVRWRDNLTGADLIPARRIREGARVVVALGEDPTARVLRELAQRIVENMQESW